MRYALVIIAALAGGLHICNVFAANLRLVDLPSGGFSAYEVEVEVIRNGIEIGNPITTLLTGETQSQQLSHDGRPSGLRINQRVTGFPGAAQYKALLQLELYGISGAGEKRLAAPTIGIELGESEVFEVNTIQGRISVRATVIGLNAAPLGRALGITTQGYPEI